MKDTLKTLAFFSLFLAFSFALAYPLVIKQDVTKGIEQALRIGITR